MTRRTPRHLRTAAALLGVFFVCAPTDLAAIVGIGDGTQNTSAPAGTPAFDNVARYRVGSAVYLGDRWLLTAGHVYGGIDTDPVTFTDGGPGYAQEGTGVRLTFPGAGGGPTDLTLIRIANDPGLPQLYFGQSPAVGTPIVMAGFGRNRQTALTRWDTSTTPWSQVSAGGDAAGYQYAAGTAKRWATNVIGPLTEGGSTVIVHDTESYLGKVTLIGADFSRSGGTPFEGVVAPGDSGGGVFANNRLVGMPLYLGTFDGQGDETAVFGNVSYFANLADYVDQIAAITRLHPGTDGDANLDGIIDTADFDRLRDHFGQAAGWTGGDFNLDGVVNFADFQVLELNFPGELPLTAAESLRALTVPEPATAIALASAALLLHRPRARRNRSPI